MNLGNTCYFNAALQCLMHVPMLCNYFLKSEAPEAGEGPFTAEFRKLARKYWTLDLPGPVNPAKLFLYLTERHAQFRGHYQQDSHEVRNFVAHRRRAFHDCETQALACILDSIDQTLVRHIFSVKVTQETLCPTGRSELREESVGLLTYPSENCTVSDALKEHFEYATLTDYEDCHGRKHKASVTRLVVTKVPPVLFLAFSGRKIIELEEVITVSHVRLGLISAVCHLGNELGGHYVAFTKHLGEWHYKDDEVSTSKVAPPSRAFWYIAMYKTLPTGCPP